jgi:hypothetical protein
MRRTGYVLAMSLGFLVLGRALKQPEPLPPPEPVVERVSFEPRMAVAVPAALKRERNLEFGYVTLDAATN